MATKLTLRVSAILIKRAKLYAKKHNKSVSQIVGDYFLLLGQTIDSHESTSLPLTMSLKGAMKKATLSEADYKKYLEKKYL